MIATANIGCQHHLAATSPVPVRHWIELLDETFAEAYPH
jgi:glycolate oxidase iron-sulfur subunit